MPSSFSPPLRAAAHPAPKAAAVSHTWLTMLGPAFAAGGAYVDPGNFATNMAAGSTFGCRLLRGLRIGVSVALGVAATVNISMLVTAAQLLAGEALDDLSAVHHLLGERSGSAAAWAFALVLPASGFAASSVGRYAGQTVMNGFLRRSVPLLVRRAVTLVPALALLIVGVDPSAALVWSRVVLSFGVLFALVPLVWFTSRRDVTGEFVNHGATTLARCLITALIVALNVLLLWGVFAS